MQIYYIIGYHGLANQNQLYWCYKCTVLLTVYTAVLYMKYSGYKDSLFNVQTKHNWSSVDVWKHRLVTINRCVSACLVIKVRRWIYLITYTQPVRHSPILSTLQPKRCYSMPYNLLLEMIDDNQLEAHVPNHIVYFL